MANEKSVEKAHDVRVHTPGRGVTITVADDAEILRMDSIGGAVMEVQNRLVAAGAYRHPTYDPRVEVDGQFKAQTERAVKQFQKDNDMEPTGIVDPETMDALRKVELPSTLVAGDPIHDKVRNLKAAEARAETDEVTDDAVEEAAKAHDVDIAKAEKQMESEREAQAASFNSDTFDARGVEGSGGIVGEVAADPAPKATGRKAK